MFNPFSTGCLSQCKCQKQQYRAVIVFGLCTDMNFGIEDAERAVEETETVKAAGGVEHKVRHRQQTAGKHPKNSSKETKTGQLNRVKRSRIKLKNNTE